MFCAKCGTQLADDAKFCASCGTPAGGAVPAEEKNIPGVQVTGVESVRDFFKKLQELDE